MDYQVSFGSHPDLTDWAPGTAIIAVECREGDPAQPRFELIARTVINGNAREDNLWAEVETELAKLGWKSASMWEATWFGWAADAEPITPRS